jgi:outer membrane receptor protein involved in Fe transport
MRIANLVSLFFLAVAASLSAGPHPIDTLTEAWAAREDSLRMAAETAAAAAMPQTDESEAAGPVLPGTPGGKGSLAGRVVSEMTGTVIAGARVILAGMDRSVETDADGNFGFADLEPGNYSLLITHPSYAPLTADSLPVAADLGTLRRLRLPDKAIQGEKVRITGKAGKSSDAGLLFAQKNAPGVSDGISTEQMSKSPDGDAAAAVKRVSGISIAGGQVYVRGLGERYVNVQLNGLTLSSPNFEKRVIPLDIFPTRLIENLVVSKSFTADQPAEFAGGALQLRTKDYPERRIFEVSASCTYEPGSTFRDMYTYKGGDLDWLGMDDGTRELPSGIPNEYFDHRTRNMGDTQAERQRRQRNILAALPNTWTPHASTSPLGQSYGLTMGNKIPLGEDRTFGWLFGGSYSGKWGVDEEYSARIGLNKASGDTGVRVPVYADQVNNLVSSEGILWGLLGTATLELGEGQKYRFNYMANRDWEDEVTRTYGKREGDNDTTLVFEIGNANQTLTNGQIEGEHRPGFMEGFQVNWMAALTGARRWEPDRRVTQYFKADTSSPGYDPEFPYTMGSTLGLQDRYWYNLTESGWGGKLDAEMPSEWAFLGEGSKLKAGTFLFSKERDYEVRRLTFAAGNRIPVGHPLRSGRYERLMGALNGAADTGYVHSRNDKEKDDYDVRDNQWAVHAQADMALPASFRAILGLRFIHADVAARARSDKGELSPTEDSLAVCDVDDRCVLPFGYQETALLPAVSLVYGLTESQNLRASWTRTFSFPEYREMAPVLFYSYQEALETVGNPRLEPTDILNYDLRWEWFPTPGDMVAVSGFYKDFDKPVETLIEQVGSNNRARFVNVPSAWLYGLEGEVRFGLGRLGDFLEPAKLVANYTWIQSEVEGRRKRSMQGQSPYLVNVILFYEPFGGRTQMSLLYNRFGERIAKVGVDRFPDVLERPRSGLEFSLSQRLPGGLKSKFTAKNITDPEAVFTQGGLVTKRVSPGQSYSLGISYAF